MSKVKSSETVKVVIRCRPLNRKEEAAAAGVTRTPGGVGGIVEMDMRLGQVVLWNPHGLPGEPGKTFTFDSVYDPSSKQRDLYDETVRPLIDSVLDGFNGTIFAYGQTGTGKTYTMQGVWLEPERRGVIPNAFEHVFTQISRSSADRQYLVRASYLEIYREEIRDLLDPNMHAPHVPNVHTHTHRTLELRESPESGVYVRDLTSCVCKSVKEIQELMNLGNQVRSVGATDMNEHSSRSHTLFLITVECSLPGPDGRQHIRVGRLNLVDLAGSERQAKTGVHGERLKEAAKINLSLSALGNVISALADGRSGHVPYRDSKLTRLLQDSLGGNAKTVMVATLGPAPQHYEETLTTLRYANRAKNIQNQPRVNEDPKDALLREFQKEIAWLRAQLSHREGRGKHRKEEGEEGWDGEGDEEGEEKVEKERMLQEGRLEEEKEAIREDGSLLAEEKQRLLGEKERMMGDLKKEWDATEQLTAKYKAMESKLLVGGKNIMDHTNEQQKTLEIRRQEIAEQSRREREIQQQVMVQDEETLELKETFSSLQQEVEAKTKKLKKLYAKLQCVKAEIQDVNDEHVRSRQELEQTQNQLTRELKFKYLIIENFIPLEEKNKIMNRLTFDPEEDQWKFTPLVPAESQFSQMKKRPASAVGYKRPISQYARVSLAMGAHSRYRAENIMFLELDMTHPTNVSLDHRPSEVGPNYNPYPTDNVPHRERAARVRMSRSWCQTPRAITSSTSTVSLATHSTATPTAAQ
ncbi:kinesin-like protein KIF3C isoform X2 [Oncorhynchus tshawytscha]|uniref:kinesin-like protein KIF3C isoform X2 n=1 Tax=Oncorhynchus tshawytscha TaxID=74940 RepID=UPI001C3CA4C1|nr:kinesin-like protein KIF3C isoform X2 [Oncorhynchus tshawytscha]